MKIVPLPPPAPVARAPAPAEPTRPFEEELDAACAFTELGMFGRGGGKPADPGRGPDTCRGPVAEEPIPAPIPEPGEEAIEPAMIAHGRAFSRDPAPAPPEARRIGRAAAPPRAKPPMPTGELPPPQPAPEHEEQEATARARRTRRPHQQPPRSDVSLIVTEKDGQIGLVAAAPRLDPETRAALRRLVRDILARSGLGLAYFQLNGTPVAADSLIIPGGFDGTRSR